MALWVIPLGPSPQWHEFSYKNIPTNQVTHSKESLRIQVNKSASPLVYSFEKSLSIKSIELQGELIEAPPQIDPEGKQGDRANDDYSLRLGLVVKGKKRLNFWQRQVAPKWLLDMESKLPHGLGVARVEFITTCQDADEIGKKTTHPLDSMLKLKCVKHLSKPGLFHLKDSWDPGLEAVALWLAADGDDTKSSFEVKIHNITIHHK